MIILGLDPGTTRLGFGIIKKDGQKLLAIDYGCIETNDKKGAEKLEQIDKDLFKIIEKHQPNAVAIEKLFFSKNVKTALDVSEAKGVAMLCAQKSGAEIFYYTPPQIKQAVVGYGGADKNQIQQMIKIILKLKEVPRPDDTADALAIAICCAHSERL